MENNQTSFELNVRIQIKPEKKREKFFEGKLKEPIQVFMPPYFEDDEECGYCGREIGTPHISCRQ